MGHEHLGPSLGGNQPIARNWDAVYFFYIVGMCLFPVFEIYCPAKRREHHKLGKRQASPVGHVERSLECILPVRGKPKNKGAQYVDAVSAKFLQLLDQAFS